MDDEQKPRPLDYGRPAPNHRARWIILVVVAVLRRAVKPLIVGAAVILILSLASYSFWVWRAKSNLNSEIALLRAAGEPMALQELTSSKIPDAENASLDYKAAGKLIDTNQPAWKNWDAADAATHAFQPPLTRDEVATMNAIVAANRPALAIVSRARAKSPGDWGDQFVRPYLQSTLKFDYKSERSLANLLMMATYAAHAADRDGEAVEHLEDMLRLGNAALKRRMLVAHLVALKIDAATTRTIWQIAPDLRVGKQGADPLAVADLEQRLKDESVLQDGRVLCWRSERICMLDSYVSVSEGTFGSAKATWWEHLLKPAFIDDARLMLIHLQGIEQASNSPDWPSAERHMPTALPNAINAHPAIYRLSSIMLPALNRAVRQDYWAVAQRHLALAALAARLYAIDHDGRLPAKLADLVPAYLPAVPYDPFSGHSILYKRDSLRPRVYSVGEDGVDDGGIEDNSILVRGRWVVKGDIVADLKIQPRPVASGSN